MPDYFPDALKWILSIEGGYIDNRVDMGGETNYGISKRAYPFVDIEHLTQDDAAKIYRRDYWNQAFCASIPYPLALGLFDAAVQHGVLPAIRMLQLVVGARIDGVVGPETIRLAKDGDPLPKLLAYLAERALLYDVIEDKHPSQHVFIKGWFTRLLKLWWYILSHGDGK